MLDYIKGILISKQPSGSKGATIVVENNNGIITANGHAYNSSDLGSNNTNFALLVSHTFTEPFKDSNEYAEDKHTRQLQELSGAEGFAEKRNLGQQHERVDDECSRAHGEIENFSDNVRDAGNRRCPQLRIGDHGDAVAHEKQTEKEDEPAFQAFFCVGVHFLRL